MKALMINKYYAPDVGGVETVIQQHAEHLSNSGHDVTVLCVKKNFSLKTEHEILNNVKIIRCSSFGTFFSMPLSITFFLHYIINIIRTNLVVFHAPFPLVDLAAFFFLPKRIKKVVFWHSDIIRQKKLKVLFDFFINNSLKQADIVLTTSSTLAANSLNLREYKEKVAVVPLSIDVNNIINKAENSEEPAPDLAKIDLENIDFISFGRLSYYKGIKVLIDALTLLSRDGITPSVLIAGQGELTDDIKTAIAREGLKNVHFLPRFLSENEKYLLLKKSRCFLFPSVANSEAFGITQLEALALGTPVINTSLPTGVPDVSLDKQTGLTVTPSDPRALAQAMKAIYLNEVDVEFFSRNAAERARIVYDDAIVLGQFSDILAGLLQKQSHE